MQILKSFIEGLLRYGNPDSWILGTLKIKIQIYGFLSFLSNNMRSDSIFRVAICLQIAKTALIWDPWKWKLAKNIKNMLEISQATKILSQVFKKPDSLFSVKGKS